MAGGCVKGLQITTICWKWSKHHFVLLIACVHFSSRSPASQAASWTEGDECNPLNHRSRGGPALNSSDSGEVVPTDGPISFSVFNRFRSCVPSFAFLATSSVTDSASSRGRCGIRYRVYPNQYWSPIFFITLDKRSAVWGLQHAGCIW